MPRHFVEADDAAAAEMARAAGFGHLVVAGRDGLLSTPTPFLIDDGAPLVVRGHLARANPLLQALPVDGLLIVPLSDAYVSPTWYPSKAEHGRVVPTWNYEVVHLHGRLVAHDIAWTSRLVRDLTDHHEAAMSEPWSVDDAPPEYVDGMLRAIVGFSLTVGRVDAKRKLSQNRSAEDRGGAADGLDRQGRRGSAEIATAMRRHAPDDPPGGT